LQRSSSGALAGLVAAARAMSSGSGSAVAVGEVEAARRAVPEPSLRRAEDATADDGADLGSLRRRVAALLGQLGRRVDAELPLRLGAALQAWDQMDVLEVLDRPARLEARSLTRTALALEGSKDPARQATGTEIRLALEAALGLVDLLERRLAVLVRLRLRTGEPLLPGGRPFLDLGAALQAAAREWT
jgi:hypothetical protein